MTTTSQNILYWSVYIVKESQVLFSNWKDHYISYKYKLRTHPSFSVFGAPAQLLVVSRLCSSLDASAEYDYVTSSSWKFKLKRKVLSWINTWQNESNSFHHSNKKENGYVMLILIKTIWCNSYFSSLWNKIATNMKEDNNRLHTC